MKKIQFIFFALISLHTLKAQDLITRTDSSKVQAVVLEINPAEVKYKLFNYNDGPTIILTKTDIAYIIFKNGVVERFPKAALVIHEYNPNTYNLDNVPVTVYNPEKRLKKCEALYKRKNYLGFNYIAFLNTALGFNYMRDIKKAHLIINVPFAFGLGSPAITNGLYGRQYLDNNASTKYDLMKYQVGVSALFAPSMNKEVNFLMGPSFNFTDYDMSVNTSYAVPSGVQYQNNTELFANKFELRRSHYGINVGFLARFAEHFNMNMLITFGFKQDSYSEKDPFGIEEINSKTTYKRAMPDNVMPYVNFAWSLGYRF